MKTLFLAKTCLLSLVVTSTILQAKVNSQLPLDEIRNFVDVYNAIKNEYVEEKEGKTLINYAIKGMLSELDPHSTYLAKEELEDFKEHAEGSYQGFGIQLEIENGQLIIISPLANSPAEKAGIQSLDKIIKIDDTVIHNLSMQEVSDLLDDLPEVTLTIITKGGKTKAVKLKRSKIDLPSISEKVFDHQYGYIRIAQFQDNTGEQFQASLQEQLDKKVKGLIIDLRNNPGGLLHAATSIANNFLEAGLIVSTKNLNRDSEEKIHAKKANTLADKLPLVVLINEGSASAAELLAAALQNHKRAVVVGQPSFGKGSVQTLIPLNNGDAIKLTTARYYTPNGQSIQAKGITPDIILSQLKVTEEDSDLLSYSEAEISGHLTAENKSKTTPKENKDKDSNKNNQNSDKKSPEKTVESKQTIKNVSSEKLAKEDLQLFEALNILKALTLTR